jgi:uncharacterized protein with NRDE domain
VCLLILALDQSPQYPLVVIANRDEDHQRPSAPADHWLDQPRIIGGRDLLHNGTWLALDRSGRFGAVTNFRDGNSTAQPRSRGDLVVEYLKAKQSADGFCRSVHQRHNEYAGFNLVVGEIGKPFCYHSNRSPGQQLTRGIFGISNGDLDNQWPKVVRAKTQLRHWLESEQQPDALFEILADRGGNSSANGDVPMQPSATAFIVNSIYGTRASTCILVDASGHVVFEERRFDPQGQPAGSSCFEFALKS